MRESKSSKSLTQTPAAVPPPVKAFVLDIQGMGGTQHWDDVVAFTGEDMSEHISFKLGSERLMAVVGFSLARAQHADGKTTYFAFPHALLYFTGDSLNINARHYVSTGDRARLLPEFESKLDDFEAISPEIRSRLHRLGEEMLLRLESRP